MWGAIISGVLGLAKAGYGAYQQSNAKKLAAQNAFPDYVIPSQFYDNVGLLQNRAQEGISQDTLAFLAQQNQQNLAGSTNAILQGGGGINSIAALYQGTNAQNAQLAQLDEQLRLQNINNLIEARKELAGQELYKWKINKYDQWRNKAVAAAMLGAQGNKNLVSGIDMFGSGVASSAQSMSANKSDMNAENNIGNNQYNITQNKDFIGPPESGDNFRFDLTGNPSAPNMSNNFYNNYNNFGTQF